MKNSLQATMKILAKNCAVLKKIDEASDVKLGKKGGIAAKTVNNLVNENTNPTLKTIVGVADAYGVEPWQLLHHDFKAALPNVTEVEQMAKALASLSDQDFAAVLRARQEAD